MSRAGRRVFLVVCSLGLVRSGWADGGMFPAQFAGSGESADQRAIVVFDEGHETLILQTAYEGESTDFAWVIPIPVLPRAGAISTVAPAVFDHLYELTEPRAYEYAGYSPQCMLGCSGDRQGQEFRSVRVWRTMRVDDYQVVALSAQESSDLEGWLNANGYAFPVGHQQELQYYVDKSWFFVGAKVSLAGDGTGTGPPGDGGNLGDGEAEEMKPLRLSFNTPEPVYPMRISAVSSNSEVEVLLYIIARHRMTSANYKTDQVELTSDFTGGDFTEFYEQQFRASLARAGAGSLLLEYAGQLPRWYAEMDREDLGLGEGDFYVTRLRTYLTQDQMQQDVVLKQAATDGGFGPLPRCAWRASAWSWG